MYSVRHKNSIHFHILRAGCLIGCFWQLAVCAQPLPEQIAFNRDIRPLLSNTCFKCHGADVSANVSGMRLDRAEDAYATLTDASGNQYTPIVPGKPAASEIIRRINSTDPNETMPPPDALHQLTDRDRALLKRWIEQGAEYQPHWSYIPPRRSTPPDLPGNTRIRNPVDQFVFSRLVDNNLRPAPEADRRTLIRRLSLDLTGLPPTSEETVAFLADSGEDAYEHLIDRLLNSPHFGERMAVPWLDLVRFADTVGYHGDQRLNCFPYRDYVINAFNRNMPFDRFTREQLAGDLLSEPSQDQLVASGFNRLNMATREGGAQPREYAAKYAADRVRTVSTTWLGSTMACAECHDHKYDPFSTRDFYAMAAYFADIKEFPVSAPTSGEPELKNFTNDYPFPPEVEVDSPFLHDREARLRSKQKSVIDEAVRRIENNPDLQVDVLDWSGRIRSHLAQNPDGWNIATPESASGENTGVAELLADSSIRFTDNRKKGSRETPVIIVKLNASPGPVASIRLTAMTDEACDGRATRDEDMQLFYLKPELFIQRAGCDPDTLPDSLEFSVAFAEQEAESYDNGYYEADLLDTWISSRNLNHSNQSAVYHLKQAVQINEGDRLIARVASKAVARIRFEVSPFSGGLPGEQLTTSQTGALAATGPTPAQFEIIAGLYYQSMGLPTSPQNPERWELLRGIANCRGGRTHSVVSVAIEPRVTRVLPRGNWQDDSGEIVLPGTPRFLPSSGPTPDARRQTRLDLARWITSRDNPLTARTFVNRLWKEFFGTGLSSVLDDLGAQGEYPSHPELLDWLAVEFMERGWDIKAMVRLMVTSSTYRQASRIRPDLMEFDPGNRLLTRQNPRRLEAEFVRDNALFASGLLNLEIGGPSAYPYQPEGYYQSLNFPKREYKPDTGSRQYRRGLYTHWQRTFLHPMLANFDASSREECSAMRNVSNTPQQALTLLNDPTFVEAARVLAEKILTETPEKLFSDRLESAFLRVLARLPSSQEFDSLETFHCAQFEYYQEEPESAILLSEIGQKPVDQDINPVELAAWTSVTRAILNLNETIVRY